MKKEQRDDGGILFSPKENQKGHYNGGGHRIASGPAAESGHPGCDASGESRGTIPREKLAFPLGFPRLSLGQKLSSFP